jgi:2-polyprenyl-3-methyl-5-hydroxy-6-metoxy-1,4-benzoquinol methylase
LTQQREHVPEQHAYRLPYHWCMTAFHKYVVQQAVERVAPYLQERIVLEMGCGDGFVTSMLARHAKRVHAFDINERAITFAKLIVEDPHVSFAVASADDLEAIAGELDEDVEVIASFEVIEHLSRESLSAFLSKSRELLSPSNGCLVLTTPNGARRGADHNPHHARVYTAQELTDLIKRAGFSEVNVNGLYLQPRWHQLEHVANTIPFRAIFRALARAGFRRPSSCRTLICVATA